MDLMSTHTHTWDASMTWRTFHDLPPEVFIRLASHLSRPEMAVLGKVCKQFSNLTSFLLYNHLEIQRSWDSRDDAHTMRLLVRTLLAVPDYVGAIWSVSLLPPKPKPRVKIAEETTTKGHDSKAGIVDAPNTISPQSKESPSPDNGGPVSNTSQRTLAQDLGYNPHDDHLKPGDIHHFVTSLNPAMSFHGVVVDVFRNFATENHFDSLLSAILFSARHLRHLEINIGPHKGLAVTKEVIRYWGAPLSFFVGMIPGNNAIHPFRKLVSYIMGGIVSRDRDFVFPLTAELREVQIESTIRAYPYQVLRNPFDLGYHHPHTYTNLKSVTIKAIIPDPNWLVELISNGLAPNLEALRVGDVPMSEDEPWSAWDFSKFSTALEGGTSKIKTLELVNFSPVEAEQVEIIASAHTPLDQLGGAGTMKTFKADWTLISRTPAGSSECALRADSNHLKDPGAYLPKSIQEVHVTNMAERYVEGLVKSRLINASKFDGEMKGLAKGLAELEHLKRIVISIDERENWEFEESEWSLDTREALGCVAKALLKHGIQAEVWSHTMGKEPTKALIAIPKTKVLPEHVWCSLDEREYKVHTDMIVICPHGGERNRHHIEAVLLLDDGRNEKEVVLCRELDEIERAAMRL